MEVSEANRRYEEARAYVVATQQEGVPVEAATLGIDAAVAAAMTPDPAGPMASALQAIQRALSDIAVAACALRNATCEALPGHVTTITLVPLRGHGTLALVLGDESGDVGTIDMRVTMTRGPADPAEGFARALKGQFAGMIDGLDR